MEKFSNKRKYLVYIVGSCEMGSEGHSSIMYPMVACGDNDEEILNDYRDNLIKTYGEDILGDVTYGSDGTVYSYYPIHKVEIPTYSVYGDVKDFSIILNFREHSIAFGGDGEMHKIKTIPSPLRIETKVKKTESPSEDNFVKRLRARANKKQP